MLGFNDAMKAFLVVSFRYVNKVRMWLLWIARWLRVFVSRILRV